MRLLSLAGITLLLVLPLGCSRDITDPDEPTPTSAITANVTSIRTYGVVTFTLNAGGAPIDSITMEYGDMQRNVFRCGGNADVSIESRHQYNWKGKIAAAMTAHSGKKYSRAAVPIDIALDTPPMVRGPSIDIAEGDSLVLQYNDLIWDEEGDPFDFDLAVSDPRVLVVRHGASLTIKGIDEDFNGSAHLFVNYSYAMSDSVPRASTRDIVIWINPRDCISGSVRDVMAGTYAGEREGGLVMNPPFTAGWVAIDGRQVSLDLATGAFKSPKLPAYISHSVSWGGFATAAGESSFTRTKTFPPGDQDVELLMHSTAGTGMTPSELRDFYREANFRLKVDGREGLHGPDYTRTRSLSDYLAASGAVVEGHTLYGLSKEQQEVLAGWVEEEINAILPAEYRIGLVRGEPSDPLPVLEQNGALVPARGTAVAFVERTPGWTTPPQVFCEGFVIEHAWIWLRDSGPPPTLGISRAAALGSFLARRAASSGMVTGARFGGRSCLALDGSGPTDYLTGADKKLLWLPVLHPPGTPIDSWWRVR